MLVEVEQHPPYLQPYAAAVRRRGAGFGALLWASRHTQATRFDALAKLADPSGRTVLDLGCGCGDLLDFFIARGAVPAKYIGLEGVSELANAAGRERAFRAVQIIRGDFVHDPAQVRVGADIIYCSGALNTIETADFYAAVANAFAAAAEAFVFNFLSSSLLAGEQYLRWHPRREVVQFARSLTSDAELRDDYLDGDCTIAMRKAKSS